MASVDMRARHPGDPAGNEMARSSKQKGTMQKVVVNHSVITLRAMTPDELDQLAIDAAKTVQEAKDSAKFTTASNSSTGKVICVLEERLEKAKSEMTVAKNTSLAKYWEGITKAKMPNHAMTCAVCFGSFVRTEMIDEKTYDLCSANIIELAGAITMSFCRSLSRASAAGVTNSVLAGTRS